MAVRPEMKEIMQNKKHRVLTVEVNPPGLVGAGRLGDKSKTEVNLIFTLRSKTNIEYCSKLPIITRAKKNLARPVFWALKMKNIFSVVWD